MASRSYMYTHASCNAVPLVWGSLRLAPIIVSLSTVKYINANNN